MYLSSYSFHFVESTKLLHILFKYSINKARSFFVKDFNMSESISVRLLLQDSACCTPFAVRLTFFARRSFLSGLVFMNFFAFPLPLCAFAVDLQFSFGVVRQSKAVTMDASMDFQVLRHSSDAFQ